MHPVATAIAIAKSRKSGPVKQDVEAPDREPILTDQEHRFLVRAGIGLGALALAGTTALVIRGQLRKAAATKETALAFGADPAATVARQLKLAFENDNPLGWGTKETVIRALLRNDISSWKFLGDVMKSYAKQFPGHKLFTDLNKELSQTEVQEVTAILQMKPQTDGGSVDPQQLHWSRAQRLKAGMEYEYASGLPWTDYDALTAVFSELKTVADWQGLKAAYVELYSIDLADALDDELWDWEFDWKGAVEKNTGITI